MKTLTFIITFSLCLPVFAADEDEEPELLTVVTGEDFRVILEAEISDLSQYRLSCDPLHVGPHSPVPPPHEPGKLFRALGLATYGVSTSDAISTEIGLARGANEMNPLQRNRTVRIAYHVAIPIVMNNATDYIHKKRRPKLALWMRIATVAAFGYLTTRNLHITMGLK